VIQKTNFRNGIFVLSKLKVCLPSLCPLPFPPPPPAVGNAFNAPPLPTRAPRFVPTLHPKEPYILSGEPYIVQRSRSMLHSLPHALTRTATHSCSRSLARSSIWLPLPQLPPPPSRLLAQRGVLVIGWLKGWCR